MLMDACCVLRKGTQKVSITNQLLGIKACYFFIQTHAYEFLFLYVAIFAMRSGEGLDLLCTSPSLNE